MIKLESAGFEVRDRRILVDVNIDVAQGAIVAIIGPNGAGKTTVLDAVSGSIKLSHGSLSVGSWSRVYQGSELPKTLTVAEVAWIAARSRDLAEQLMSSFGLYDYRNLFVAELSLGMRRILDLAVACAKPVDALLLDEPSTGLARSEVDHLGPIIKRTREQMGCSVLLVEHDPLLVMETADEVIAMDRGMIVARGAPEIILQAPSARKTN